MSSMKGSRSASTRALRPNLGSHEGERLRNHGVETQRPLTAAEHQQARAAFTVRESHSRRRQRRNVRAHRIADGACMNLRPEAPGKCLQHLAREARQPAIGHAGDGVLFMDQQGNSQQPRGDAARAADVAARPQDRAGPHSAQYAQGLRHGFEYRYRRQQPRLDTLASNARDPHPFDRKAVRRHQPRLHAPGHSQPDHGNPAIAQYLGHRERGKYMPAGAARHDEDRAAAHRTPPGMRVTAERELHLTS